MRAKPIPTSRPAVMLVMVLSGIMFSSADPAHALPASPAAATNTTEPTVRTTSPPPAMMNSIRVEVSPTIVDATEYPRWVNDRQPNIGSRFPEASGHEQWILVKIGGSTYDYELTVTAMRDGRPVGPVDEPLSCECNSNDLLALIDGELAEAVQQLHSFPAEPEVSPKRCRGNCPLGPMGYAGIAGGVLGIGALGGGIALIRRPYEYRWSQGMLEEGTTRPSGIAWTVIGGVALVAGIALTVVDVIRRRNRRVASPSALATSNPARSPR